MAMIAAVSIRTSAAIAAAQAIAYGLRSGLRTLTVPACQRAQPLRSRN